MTVKRSELKRQLLEQARKRPTPRATSTQATAISGAEATRTVPERFTRFDAHPGYQQLVMMRQGAKQLGLIDPFFKVHDGLAGATSVIDGHECINFASYNYLGYSGDPRVVQAASDAAAHYGTSVSASRVVSGERPIHGELEQAIANIYGVEDAVVFVSGHATNVSTLGYLLGPKDLVLHDEYIHNSSLVGAQLSGAKRISFSHNDPAALDALLSRHRHQFERVLVVIEGLYSMDGDIPDLPRFIELKQRHQAWLMVDEAHSFGVMGDTGLGLREHFAIDPTDVDIWMGTMSKTLSGCGGYIAGNKALVETLRYFAPGFLYSVGMPAQVAAPSLKVLELMPQETERVTQLQAISHYFLEQAQARGMDTGHSIGSAVVPVIVGSSPLAAHLSHALFAQHINVQPILYPAVPEKSARLRFFLSCEHTKDHVDQTLDALALLLANAKG
ncbi:aminotransferase class I/II-fold pyridoxal phosphate-dependent enzyme [Halomonas sp. XH26]|uniref:Aminotransferase class I/II-fold pyridoxal phosphate-dependent enzyme n=1 Tax=Vreelandella alkaliphila TaxID=272774 RepID=A0AAJ2RUZ5_9GAMM|nr:MULTISPECIES: aminotransferase class I/II-fold pyridoxal phosphate-dependent enzyme [Halomonas]AIA76716.1 8-amino-7-oxononanoate synthase [Halomonas campaniensis]AYF34630.1 8-amino-7-oxononanoate synthase [Halomonas alkaliphila]MDX5976646.1 aminotransferase class I/II-fold pyridoxal phosphate-dependent enzyme [Halomonas alkaliphila]UTA78599.1 aminotransferase class I/II-fold pyridoxal phosphate-dependent enzyme [Halomonas sp. XH26]